MGLVDAIILGGVQGLTEFLPISSSGHLVFAHQFLNYDPAQTLTFDLALHVGTLLALVVFFWTDLGRLVRALIVQPGVASDRRLAWRLAVAIIPAALAGALFEPLIEALRQPWVAVGTLAGVGLLFLLVERRRTPTHPIESTSFATAIGIGLAQALALIPGVSRSGITIVAGMYGGLSRADAARFTFLLSIPTVAGAALKKLLDHRSTDFSDQATAAMIVGAATAAIVGYTVVRFLMRYLASNKLNAFAYYRLIVAGLAAAILVIQ